MVAEYQTGGESYFVTAFTFAQGRHWMQRQNDLDRLQLIGRALGRLHSRAKRYTPGKAVIRRRAYSESQHLIQAHKVLPKYDPALYDCFTKFLSTLASLPKSADTFGLTHGDFLFSNYHITDDDRVILFDFDECEYSWYVSDIAVCLYYYLLGGDPSELDGKTEDAERFLVSLMSGYLRENDLPPEELRRIELFFRLRDYILLSTIIGRGEKTLGGWDQAFLDSTLPRVTGNQPFAGIDIDTVGRRLYPF